MREGPIDEARQPVPDEDIAEPQHDARDGDGAEREADHRRAHRARRSSTRAASRRATVAADHRRQTGVEQRAQQGGTGVGAGGQRRQHMGQREVRAVQPMAQRGGEGAQHDGRHRQVEREDGKRKRRAWRAASASGQLRLSLRRARAARDQFRLGLAAQQRSAKTTTRIEQQQDQRLRAGHREVDRIVAGGDIDAIGQQPETRLLRDGGGKAEVRQDLGKCGDQLSAIAGARSGRLMRSQIAPGPGAGEAGGIFEIRCRGRPARRR